MIDALFNPLSVKDAPISLRGICLNACCWLSPFLLSAVHFQVYLTLFIGIALLPDEVNDNAPKWNNWYCTCMLQGFK